MIVLKSERYPDMYFVPFADDSRRNLGNSAEFCSEGNIKVYLISSQSHMVNEVDLQLFYHYNDSNFQSMPEYVPIFFNARLICK